MMGGGGTRAGRLREKGEDRLMFRLYSLVIFTRSVVFS